MALTEEELKTLPREVYQALENIVGPDNISEEPALLDSYAYQLNAELSRGGSKFLPRPIAAIVPASTEEVAAIVKVCNKYKVKFKSYSTGWGVQASPRIAGVVHLDLRRMDRILEIDPQNMYAVIEPYVICATLQAEAMKYGLNTHIIGAGAGSSVLAAATSFLGTGPSAIFMGYAAQNLLALEWVTPTGDIVRTGSQGSGIGWFCGEGPGPSVRAITRGWTGAYGGFGVFTKCAVKLYPWPGPQILPVEGTIPAYDSPLPDNFRAYTIAFPNWQAYADAILKIYDAEIGYIAHRQFPFFGVELQAALLYILTDPTKQLEDLPELLKKPEIQKLTEEMRISFQMVLAGQTARDIEYQEKALDEILAETGGWKVKALMEPKMQKYTLMYFVRLPFKNYNFIYGGAYAGSFSIKGSPDWVVQKLVPQAMQVLGEHQKKGLIVDCGADSMMGALSDLGGGGRTWGEQFSFYDPHDKQSIAGATDYITGAVMAARAQKWPPSYDVDYMEPFGPKRKYRLSHLVPHQAITMGWQRKIKAVFDPNNCGEGSYSTTEDPDDGNGSANAGATKKQ